MSNASLLPGFLLCCAGAAGMAATLASSVDDADAAALRTQLESVARRRIFFGHQSVGFNILEGVAELSARARVPLRIAEVSRSLDGAAGSLLHAAVPENGNPGLKLESFARLLDSAASPGVDVALLKFCFVDFGKDTDAKALFARYQAAIAALRARHPGTVFVHATVPLTAVQRGFKALVKKAIGRAPYGIEEDVRREEYNALLRRAYLGREPVYDIARIESLAPDGKAETVEWNGRAVPALFPGYTEDGGHLNRDGRLRAARRD